MFTYQFWQLAIERAVKTFAQNLLTIFSITGVGLRIGPWTASLSIQRVKDARFSKEAHHVKSDQSVPRCDPINLT